MKNLLKLLPLFLLSGLAAFAQTQPTPPTTAAPAKMQSHNHKMPAGKMHAGKMAKDCCMMKDGKMMMMKDGKMMPMTGNMTMSDGTVCMTNGTCVKKDGAKMTMKNGQCMMMDGKMTSMDHMMKNGKMKPDAKMGNMKM